VAADARLGQPRERRALVALPAGDAQVGAGELVLRGRVVEGGRSPCPGGMACAAVACEVAVVRRGSVVAGRARRRGRRRRRDGVAPPAGHAGVGPRELERRRVVIERGIGPGGGLATSLAVATERAPCPAHMARPAARNGPMGCGNAGPELDTLRRLEASTPDRIDWQPRASESSR